MLDVLQVANDSDTVAHLKAQVGRSQQVYAGTVDTCAVEPVAVVQTQATKGHAIEFALGDDYTTREYRGLCRLPVDIHFVAEDGAETFDILRRAYDQ